MTAQSNTTEKFRKYRWPIRMAASLSSSTLTFTVGCAVTRYLTDSVNTQLGVGLLLAVVFLTVILFLAIIRRNKVAVADITLSDAAMGILMHFGFATLFFPLMCTSAADVLKQHIPPVVYDAIRVSGILALMVFGVLIWVKMIGQMRTAKSTDEM